jgi:hypothetical protein
MPDEDKKLTAKQDGGKMPTIRSKAFRSALMGRLPKLGQPTWRSGDTADVHDSIAGLSDLSADTFLEVVARFREKTHEQ